MINEARAVNSLYGNMAKRNIVTEFASNAPVLTISTTANVHFVATAHISALTPRAP